MGHIVAAQFLWLHRIKGLPPAQVKLWGEYTLDQLFDMAENILMLKSISGHYTAFSLQATFYCAWIKFMILLFILLFLLISLPRIIRKS